MRQNSVEFVTWRWAVLLIVLGTGPVNCVSKLWDFDLNDYSNHVCKRPCDDHTTPRLCHYDFLVENYYTLSKACFDCPYNQSNCNLPQCASAGGVPRVIRTVNRIMPGPPIEVCEGDIIEVKLTNMLDGSEGTTIHWHGILQQNTQYMDGTPMVTQCPIMMGSQFTYRFLASDVGTYFWHGHAGTQRADGLFGPLIIRQRPSKEPHFRLYDHDLSEHVIIVNDWPTIVSTDRLAELVHIRENLDMTILINGKAQFHQFVNETTNTTYYTPRATFTVSPGHRYRFRVINSGVLNCPLEISIDNHNLTIIASDGSPTEPLVREKVTIHAGERYDFVLTARNTSSPRNYWIKVRGLQDCTGASVTQTAILKYQGSTTEEPPEPPKWEPLPENDEDYAENTPADVPIVEQLRSLEEADDVVLGKPDRKIFLHVDMITTQNLRAYNPPYYAVKKSALFESPQINGITGVLPPAPPLLQLEDIPKDIFCNEDTIQQNCEEEWCVCVHLYVINLGDLVELLILDDDAYHPMHLHGYKFRVVGNGKLEDGTALDVLKQLDYKGLLNRTTGKAPLKDTVAAPVGGYNILRFRANNPGFWLFHCHLEFHAETGMLLIFQVGNSTQLPPRPRNARTCGSWDFTGLEDDAPTGGRTDSSNTCTCNVTCNNVKDENSGDNNSGGSAGLGNICIIAVVVLVAIVS